MYKQYFYDVFSLMEEENTDGDDIHSYMTDAGNRFIAAMTTGEYKCLDHLPRAEIAELLATPEAQADFVDEFSRCCGNSAWSMKNYRKLCEAHMIHDREAFEALLKEE